MDPFVTFVAAIVIFVVLMLWLLRNTITDFLRLNRMVKTRKAHIDHLIRPKKRRSVRRS